MPNRQVVEISAEEHGVEEVGRVAGIQDAMKQGAQRVCDEYAPPFVRDGMKSGGDGGVQGSGRRNSR